MAAATSGRRSRVLLNAVTAVLGLTGLLGLTGEVWRVTVEAAHKGEPVPFQDRSQWKTNFRKHSVDLKEITSGGPPKDGIPAIDRPRFETVAAAGRWLKPQEPVIVFGRGGDHRAYPLQILTWHEIANDVVGGVPVVVTFCPLCNTALVFERRIDGRLLDFGTTGKLRFSDLVMYDRQTESWWQQATGEAIVGDFTGRRLTFLPAQIVSWDTFRAAYPQGKVLSRATGHSRSYGRNPYVGYDNVNSAPFLYSGPRDGRLRPMERVVAVSHGGEDVAYPFSVLEKLRVVHDGVGGRSIVILFERGTASALDAGDVAGGRDIGASGVFVPLVKGRRLTFLPAVRGFTDRETGSSWTLLGQAIAGPLRGQRLEPVVHGDYFWFAWAVFRPKTRIYRP